MPEQTSDHERLNLQPIRRVSTLLSNIEKIEKDQECSADQRALQYYRGLSNDRHKLKPSVMRDKKHYANEGEMLRDLLDRPPSGESYRERGARRRTKSNDLRCHGALGSPSSRPWHRLFRAPAVGGEARLPHTASTAPRHASVADAVRL